MTDQKTTICYFSSTDYSFLVQRPQQLFQAWRRLSSEQFDFVYVEPPRTLLKVRNWKNMTTDPSVIRPFLLFPPTMFKNRSMTIWAQHAISSRIFAGRRAKKKVAIVSTSFWEPFIDRGEYDLICYDYLDSIEVFANDETMPEMLKKHDSLLAKSDIVFTTADNLKEEVLSKAPHKKVVPVSNGVDVDFFQEIAAKESVKDYVKGERRVVGYVGALFNWIDVALIVDVAREMSYVDFVLVGPLSEENKQYLVTKPDNVFFLDKKQYREVPCYISIFDVALIPFNISHISDSTDPIKLYEYFSLGKPVVATPMKQLYKYDNGCLLRIARTKTEFIESILHYLDNCDDKCRFERKQIAENNSWLSKAQTMTDTINSSLLLSHKL